MTRDLALSRITPAQQDAFLTVYRTTGLFNKAAQAAGTTKGEIEKYCQSKTADAETFQLNLQDAAAQWADVIEAEITRRAITGVQKAIYYKGEFVDWETVYSDTLLVKLAEAKLPEFKKQSEQPHAAIQIQINTFADSPATIVIDEKLPSLE
jgi:hypothetical protein